MGEAGDVCCNMCDIIPAGDIAGASKNNKIAEKISWYVLQLIFLCIFPQSFIFALLSCFCIWIANYITLIQKLILGLFLSVLRLCCTAGNVSSGAGNLPKIEKPAGFPENF